MILAKVNADADAEIVQAEGAKEAAEDVLSSNAVAKIERTGREVMIAQCTMMHSTHLSFTGVQRRLLKVSSCRLAC